MKGEPEFEGYDAAVQCAYDLIDSRPEYQISDRFAGWDREREHYPAAPACGASPPVTPGRTSSPAGGGN